MVSLFHGRDEYVPAGSEFPALVRTAKGDR